MPCDGKSVSFVVRQENIALIGLDSPRLADKAGRPVKFVFNHADDWDHEAFIFENFLGRAHLRFAAVNDEDSRQGPLGVVEATRERFFERRNVVVRRSTYLEFS